MEQSIPPPSAADFAVCDFCYKSLDLTYDRLLETQKVNDWIEVCPAEDIEDSFYNQLYCNRCASIWKVVNKVKEENKA